MDEEVGRPLGYRKEKIDKLITGSLSTEVLFIFLYFCFFFKFRLRLRFVDERKISSLFQFFTIFPCRYFASSLSFPDILFCCLTQPLFRNLIVLCSFKLFLVPFPALLSCIFTVNGRIFYCTFPHLLQVTYLFYIL